MKKIKEVRGWKDRRTGYDCLAVKTALGHWCGYVALPDDHALNGVDYSDERFDFIVVHGGVTFTDTHTQIPDVSSDIWWVGFDCAHAGDYIPGIDIFDERRGTYRDIDYVKQECHSLAAQLMVIEEEAHALSN